MPDQATVSFDRPMLKRLRAARQKAEAAGLEQFSFEGHDYLVSYAKYLIEYLDDKLPKP